MMDAAGEQTPGNGSADPQPHPAREMSLHLLRMLETRMDAAGIVMQAEMQLLVTRLQLRLLAAAAIFIAIWGGIVLLAIVLPEAARVPVLSAVIAAFVIAAVWAQLAARRQGSAHGVGSLSWLLESLKLDLEVLSRSLSQSATNSTSSESPRSPPNDLAA